MKISVGLLAGILLLFAAASGRAEDRIRVGRSVRVNAGESADDVVCFACSVRVNGQVHGDVVAFAGEIEVQGEVDGDAVAIGGGIGLLPDAHLFGDAVAFGGPVLRDPQAEARGQIVSKPWFYLPGQRNVHGRGAVALLGFNLLLVALFFVALRPRRVGNMAVALDRRFGWILLAGLGVTVVAALLFAISSWLGRAEDAVVYAVTLLLVVFFVTGLPGLARWAGGKTWPQLSPFTAALFGALLITVMELIPLFGALAFFAVLLLAFGSVAMGAFRDRAIPAAPPVFPSDS